MLSVHFGQGRWDDATSFVSGEQGVLWTRIRQYRWLPAFRKLSQRNLPHDAQLKSTRVRDVMKRLDVLGEMTHFSCDSWLFCAKWQSRTQRTLPRHYVGPSPPFSSLERKKSAPVAGVKGSTAGQRGPSPLKPGKPRPNAQWLPVAHLLMWLCATAGCCVAVALA